MNNILKVSVNSWGIFILSVMMSMFSLVAQAQGTRISGTVEDDMGPVMMANVVERDGNNRIINQATTDFNGNFAMTIKSPKNKLVISYVGNKTVTLPLNQGKTIFKVYMESATQLQEVVVKAEKKTNMGGLNIPVKEMTVAAQTFNMEDVEGLSFTSADEALQGEIAGLDIVASSGNIGSGTQMRLRGVSTVFGDANPLIVVDGKIFDNPEGFDFDNADEEQYASLLSVSPDDIASIDVLKDAAATAVWGTNGANGVIEIKTKRGIRGKTKVSFSYKFTGTWMPDGYKLLNGDQYTMMLKESFFNPSQSSTATASIKELNYDRSWADFENWNNNTDWVDAVSTFGQLHNINMNISGGGEKATFRISGSYDNQKGHFIKQSLNRLTTRLVLDYDVSDRIRFSTNFALTYTDVARNYSSNLYGVAQQMAPNMAIHRQDEYGRDTNEYYYMNPSGNPENGNFSSTQLSDIRALGNPVAIANLAYKKEKTYRITPDFTLRYELLGTNPDSHRLTFLADVDFDIYSNSAPTWYPGSLSTGAVNGTGWTSNTYNYSANSEYNSFRMGLEGRLTFTPHFNNPDFNSSSMIRYQMHTVKTNSQSIEVFDLPSGITSPTVEAARRPFSNSTGRGNDENILFNTHFSYRSVYSLGFNARLDGTSAFGPAHKWAWSYGISGRYNISDERFMEWLPKVISLVSLRASYGIVGKAPSSQNVIYNYYTPSAGSYGKGTGTDSYATISGLRLDDLRHEKKNEYNIGANLNFFDDRLAIDFNYYNSHTKDLLMRSVNIPSTTGYGSIDWFNGGELTNKGWELNISGRDFVTIAKKLKISASFNIAQNVNNINQMDERCLRSNNSTWASVKNPNGATKYSNLIQVNNPLGAIYGYKFDGVYQYSYAYMENYRKDQEEKYAKAGQEYTTEMYQAWINSQLASGATFPVAVDANGHVVMNNDGSPQRMVYNYGDTPTGNFDGGDAIFRDINHDGQINALDIIYLGSSLPKFNGGFSITLKYGNWKLTSRFNFRYGNKIANTARASLESMYGVYNQAATVNYRWRKDGDKTAIPRALHGVGWNYMGSSKYVEDGSFLRWQNLQLSYTFPKKQIKKLGVGSLSLYFSMNNLVCWTKYSGVDPEISSSGWGVAADGGKTPRSKQFTASMNIGF